MTMTDTAFETPKSAQWLRRLSRISAWLLLATIAVLAVSGWGITRTDIIYKASFHLIDRAVADTIHRASNLPIDVFLSESRFN